MMSRCPALLVVGVLAVTGALGVAQPAAQPRDVLKAHFIYVTGTSSLIPLIAQEQGFFKDAGLEVALQRSTTGTEGVQALFGGSTDFTTTADARVLQALSRDLPVVVVGVNGYGFLGKFLVPASDTKSRTMADLKGQPIVAQVGSGVHTVWTQYLETQGLSSGDFQVKNLPVPDMPAALQAGSAKGAIMWEPFASRSVKQGLTRVLLTEPQIAGPVGSVYPFYLVTSRKVIQEKRDVVQRLMNAWVRSSMWITENPAKAKAFLGETFARGGRPLEPEVLNVVFDQQKYDAYTVDDRFVKDTSTVAKQLVKLGTLKATPDLMKSVDNSFAEKAVQASRAAR